MDQDESPRSRSSAASNETCQAPRPIQWLEKQTLPVAAVKPIVKREPQTDVSRDVPPSANSPRRPPGQSARMRAEVRRLSLCPFSFDALDRQRRIRREMGLELLRAEERFLAEVQRSFRAQPIRRYQRVEISGSDVPLTVPKSPFSRPIK